MVFGPQGFNQKLCNLKSWRNTSTSRLGFILWLLRWIPYFSRYIWNMRFSHNCNSQVINTCCPAFTVLQVLPDVTLHLTFNSATFFSRILISSCTLLSSSEDLPPITVIALLLWFSSTVSSASIFCKDPISTRCDSLTTFSLSCSWRDQQNQQYKISKDK